MNSPIMQVFADHESSLNPIDVPRSWIWNLPRRTVYFGTSVSTIFKGKRIIIYKHLLHSYPYLSKNEAYTNKKTMSIRPINWGNSILLLERYGILTSIIHPTLSALVEHILYHAHITRNRKKQYKDTFLTSQRMHLIFPIISCSNI